MTYLDYLKEVICYPGEGFNDLLQIMQNEIFYLNESDLNYEMDCNRIADGLALREEYEMHGFNGESDHINFPKTPEGTCTFLEFLAALARRIENDYLYDPMMGNRTWLWFTMMLNNMGLMEVWFKNDHIDPHDVYYIQKRMFRVIEKDYNDDGTDGGLFPIPNRDVKNLEIWDQMRLYLRENRIQ